MAWGKLIQASWIFLVGPFKAIMLHTEFITWYRYILIPHKLPDNKVHGANMVPTWVLSAPCWPHEPCYQGCFFLEYSDQTSSVASPVIPSLLTSPGLLVTTSMLCNTDRVMSHFNVHFVSLRFFILPNPDKGNYIYGIFFKELHHLESWMLTEKTSPSKSCLMRAFNHFENIIWSL